MLTIRTVLHPTDFSESSATAFRLACAFARARGAKLIVLHVDPPPVSLDEVAARRLEGGPRADLAENCTRSGPTSRDHLSSTDWSRDAPRTRS